VNIVLDYSTNYASWRDLMEQDLQRYTLIKHVMDDTPSNDLGWIQIDIIILNWISNSISVDLHQVVWERGCTVHHLDAAFHTLVQGDLSVNEYCHEFKAMTSDLADLSTLVEDRILILNILLGLNQCFEHVGSIIRRYSPFPNFLKVQDDLLLEEVHTDSTGPPTAPTALYTNVASLAAKALSSTPSHLPNGGNGGIGGNRTKYINKNRNSSNDGGKNSNGGAGRGGYFG
jgi:hypothetical protein